MVRSPCCDENGLKKGPWTPEEDQKLIDYIGKHGHSARWKELPKFAGLNRCGKSCRLRWTNYLRPDIKRGRFSEEEERTIINLHSVLGNKWSKIATHLPNRTDNEIKNYWNTHIRKKLLQMDIDPNTHQPRTDLNPFLNLSQLLSGATFGNSWDNDTQLAKLHLLQNLLQCALNTTTFPSPSLENTTLPISQILQGPKFEGPMNKPGTSQEPMVDSSAGFEVGISLKGQDEYYDNMISNTSNDIQVQNLLPALVSNPSGISSINSKEKESSFSIHSPTSNFFETWDKLMEDETSGWKDILDSVLCSPQLANN